MNLMVDETVITMEHLPIRRNHRRKQNAKERPMAVELTAEIKPLRDKLTEFEAAYIQHVLNRHNGNISRAARELMISRQSLQYRLRKLGIRRE
jgi:arginine utilization regulatory protein